MAERISFAAEVMPYESVLAAEHIVRYASVQDLCRRKRVLDIACGEGYGSAYLARAGAEFVLGVDISEDAITAAKKHFSHDNIAFETCDALNLTPLSSYEKFDVIVSFETLEHVSDPQKFLREILKVLKPSGSIIISCPNDTIDIERGYKNPFHTRAYTFEEFKELSQGVLGTADQWFLATPLTGMTIQHVDDLALSNTSHSMALCLETTVSERALGIPAQPSQRVSPDQASFYIGVWNGYIPPAQVHAPISRRAMLEPWWTIDYFKGVLDEATKRSERDALLIKKAEERLIDLRRASSIEQAELQNRHRTQVEALEAELSALREQTRFLIQQNNPLHEFRQSVTSSRAHRLAARYVRFAKGNSLPVRLARPFRPLAGASFRLMRKVLRRVRMLSHRPNEGRGRGEAPIRMIRKG